VGGSGADLPDLAARLPGAVRSVRGPEARLELGVRNVLDRAYMELRAGDYVAPGEPRTFTLTLSRAFGR
jgi:outer membrane receptor protein involved in Fe transport